MTGLPRIVHLASGREWRGGQRQVLLLARALGRLGLDQVVITTAGSRLAAELQTAGVPARAVGWRAGLSPRALVAAIAETSRARSILHAHDAHALTLAGLASLVSRTPVVVTRRTNLPLRRRGFWTNAAAVIAISEAVRHTLVADGIDPARITVVPSGIDRVAAVDVRQDATRTALGLPPHGPLAVTVAALTREKDHATLLRTAARLRHRFPDLHWALAGDGNLRTELEALARDLGITPIIHFLGQINEPRRLIAAGTVFVLTSIQEGLGTTILDAQALRIPVVATGAGGIPELLRDGAGVLVPPGDVAGLAEGIAQVIASGDLRDRLVAKGHESVARFTDSGMATGVLQVYRSVVLERW